IDWVLTTPLMLLKFPLMLGIGEKGKSFMIRLVTLDLVMVLAGYFGELYPASPLIHNGLFLVGCAAWLGILWMMFHALSTLPDYVANSVRQGVRTMGFFMFLGWAIYPAGYMAPALGVPADVRELVYNFADLFNKVGLCVLVYVTARRADAEIQQYDGAPAATYTDEQVTA
ncbi:MAG: bacteriorhodopsin, partial [Limisphaerales bacterium]